MSLFILRKVRIRVEVQLSSLFIFLSATYTFKIIFAWEQVNT